MQGGLTITGAMDNGGARQEAFVGALSATGGTSPYTWSVGSGSLPTGLSLNSSTGAISGNIGSGATLGANAFVAHVVDANGLTGDALFTIYVGAVVALLHMDGSNGGTTFTDETGRTWTASSVTTSTAQKKFGTASADFTSGAAQLYTASATPDLQFNATAWTVDYWLRPQSGGGTYHQVLAKRSGSTSRPFNHFYTPSDGNFYINVGTSGGEVGATTNLSLSGTQYHIAQVKDGNTLRTFAQGVQLTPVDLTGISITDATDALCLGLNDDLNSITQMRGYIDEFRITQGVARWVSAFTPPAAASNFPS